MTSIDGISFDVTTGRVSRTILSSVGGFSQSARQHIRSLQDLLATIQRFQLEVFDSRNLHHEESIGEGVSYKVSSRVHTRTRKLYAVKTVKLPAQGSDSGAFERQVACVLRDVEVMFGLADRRNILDIYGYGWDVQSGNVIPFLVTELATEGTLRQFLRNSSDFSVHDQLLFCKDIAQGLHSLHVSGIAHGDLKLDNVLVTPYVGTQNAPLEQGLRTTGMEARISDFGHSLHLYDEEGDAAVKQRYGGTLAYNAPEILDKQHLSREDVNFRKCDMWSLGLACWEILIGGKAYYHNADVEYSILSSQRRSESQSSASAQASNAPSQASSTAVIEDLARIAPQLAAIACKEIFEKTRGILTPREVDRLQVLLRRCIDSDPTTRLADIPLLPFFQGQGSQEILHPTSARVPLGSGTTWSYELFRIAGTIPEEVKKQLVKDCEKIANEPGQSILAARACFQLALANASGFGVPKDIVEATFWFEKSADKGLRLAALYKPALGSLSDQCTMTHDECRQQYFESTQSAFKAKFLSTLSDTTDENADLATDDIEKIIFEMAGYLTYMMPFDESGNTPLTLASKLGLEHATREIIASGSSSIIDPDQQGCVPLHWLFMYPTKIIPDVARILSEEDQSFTFTEETDEKMLVTSNTLLRSRFNVSHRLDPQLPLELTGNPLSFSVSVYCVPAVQALLDLGADPLASPAGERSTANVSSALAIAFRLRMADIFDLLLQHLRIKSSWYPLAGAIFQSLQVLTPAPHLETALIHGPFLEQATRDTYRVLLKHYGYAGLQITIWELLCHAAHNCNPDLCSIILHLVEGDTPNHGLKDHQLDDLMYICTIAACDCRDLSQAIKMMEFAIDTGCSLNNPPKSYTSIVPMFVAIDRHQADLLEWMLDTSQLDVSVRDQEGNNALHRLITSGFFSSFDITKLISRGVDPSATNLKGVKPIELLLDEQHLDQIKILLPLTHMEYSEKLDLLETAVEGDAPKLVSAYLEGFNWPSGDRQTSNKLLVNRVFDNAARLASAEVAEILVAHGARSSEYFGLAARCGNIDVLKVCLQHGPELFQGNTTSLALLQAVMALVKQKQAGLGFRACTLMLLETGANPDHPHYDQRTPLTFLLESSQKVRAANVGLIAALLEAGADPNKAMVDVSAEHPISKAIKEGNLDLAHLLLKHGMALHRSEHSNDLHLHHCVGLARDLTIDQTANSRAAMMAIELFKHGEDPLVRDDDGNTALELAVKARNGPVTLVILQHLSASDEVSHALAQTSRNKSKVKSSRARLRMILKESPLEDSSCRLQPRPLTALQEAWGLAVFTGSYSCICAFLRIKAEGPIRYLTRRLAISLLQYSARFEILDVLRKYFGGRTEDGQTEKPDEYLSSVLNSVRYHFQSMMRQPSDKTITPSIVALPTAQITRICINDCDMPSDPEFLHRLQHLLANGGNIEAIPAAYRMAYGFVEMQGWPDLKEVIVAEVTHNVIFPMSADDELTDKFLAESVGNI